MRSPIKYPGGKSYLCKKIISMVDWSRCEIAVQTHCGGDSIGLNHPLVNLEVSNDIDPDLINFWNYYRYPDFVDTINGIDYSEHNFLYWSEVARNPLEDPVRRAVGYMVRNRMSRSALGRDYGWSDRLRGGKPENVNAWDTIRAELYLIARRTEYKRYLNLDAAEVIRMYDSPKTVHYIDPTYMPETRVCKKLYGYEMNRESHVLLLCRALLCRGHVIISGYDNDLYSKMLRNWNKIEINMPNHMGQGKTKQRRVECLWSNR